MRHRGGLFRAARPGLHTGRFSPLDCQKSLRPDRGPGYGVEAKRKSADTCPAIVDHDALEHDEVVDSVSAVAVAVLEAILATAS
jgi:hypothetical protein